MPSWRFLALAIALFFVYWLLIAPFEQYMNEDGANSFLLGVAALVFIFLFVTAILSIFSFIFSISAMMFSYSFGRGVLYYVEGSPLFFKEVREQTKLAAEDVRKGREHLPRFSWRK